MRISVVRYRGEAPSQPLAFDFDRRGGRLGREAGNELTLPDPERHVSRVQARVDFDGRGFVLVDLGSNPTLVDGRPLGKGQRQALSGGEHITMGPYDLLVEAADGSALDAASALAPAPSAGTAAPASEDPFAVFSAQPAPRLEPVAALDPFAPPVPVPESVARDELGLGAPPGAASIDELFGLRAGQSDAFAGTPLAASEAQPVQQPDPLALFGAARSADARAGPQRDDAPLLEQAFSPPQPIKLSPGAAAPAVPSPATRLQAQPGMVLSWQEPSTNPQPAGPPSSSERELQEALLRGLGVPLELPAGLTPELMEQIGVMLREATQGTLDLLKARAITKRQVRAEVTMIASCDNNPLKFSPDIAFALAQLVSTHSKGFMPGSAAMRDAYDDLRAHQLGMMAGMRSALAGVLARFEPAALEARVSAHNLLDRLQPSGRKARLWDLFGQQYAELAREAADDFNALFGKAFLAAYEQQVERLQLSARDDLQPPARPV